MRLPSAHAFAAQLTRAQVLSGLLLALPLAPSPLAAADGVQRSIHRAEGMQRSMDRVKQLLLSEPSLAGTLLRCAFHDCVTRDGSVGGSNGSLRWELSSRENRHIDVGIAALDTIYDAVDGSFADLIAAAGAVAVTQSGGPQITARDLGQGRIDARAPDPTLLTQPLVPRGCPPLPKECRDAVRTTLPSTGLSTDGMRAFFGRLGFTEAETVALCGTSRTPHHQRPRLQPTPAPHCRVVILLVPLPPPHTVQCTMDAPHTARARALRHV